MLTVIIFIIILGLLVFVHELGHFWSAKKMGVKVEEFGFGFPPRIFGIKKGETIYSINLIPLGGFVKIFGEEGEARHDARSFAHKKIWQRTLILLAGVSMNIFLAAALLMFGNFLGMPEAIDDAKEATGAWVQITESAPGSPAHRAGIKAADKMLELSSGQAGVAVNKVSDVQGFIAANLEKEIEIKLQRGQEILMVKAVPRVNPPSGEGALGVGLARVVKISYPWYQAIWEGLKQTAALVWLTLSSFGYLLWQLLGYGRTVGEIAGPVGIYSITGQAAQMGFIYLLQLTALLSINLAIINAFPFPALDGGRVLFLIIEKIKGSPVSQSVERGVHAAGFICLLLLMLFITVKDIMRIF